MTDTDQTPRIGEQPDIEPGESNLDVSNTVGPDFLAQETVNVQTHPYDRPGVQADLPPGRRRGQDTGTELPVLLSSSITTDPIEGSVGSYTVIEEGYCERCGYDRLRVTRHLLGGPDPKRVCNACNARAHGSGQMTLPETTAERAQKAREWNKSLGTAGGYDVLATQTDSVQLVSDDALYRFDRETILDLVDVLIDRDDTGDVTTTVLVSLSNQTEHGFDYAVDDLSAVSRLWLGMGLLPSYVTVTEKNWADDPLEPVADCIVQQMFRWLSSTN